MQDEWMSPWAALARIRRPQGRKGEVFAELLTDFPQKFSERKRLWLLAESPVPVRQSSPQPSAPRQVELIAHWLHKGGVVLHFSGIESISQAEELAGLLVVIPHSERAPLGEDEVYIADLEGCALVDVSGDNPRPVGEIHDVDRSAGPVALLVVRGASGELLVPFAKSYLRKIDLENRRVEMDLPEGLLDLNTPAND
jgi:16S rRNA processing protein RimM